MRCHIFPTTSKDYFVMGVKEPRLYTSLIFIFPWVSFLYRETNSPRERYQQHRKQHLLKRVHCMVCIRNQPHRKQSPISRANLCQLGGIKANFTRSSRQVRGSAPALTPPDAMHLLGCMSVALHTILSPLPIALAPTLFAKLITLSVTLGPDSAEVSAHCAHPAEPWLGLAGLLLSEVRK